MRRVILVRVTSSDQGTFGHLRYKNFQAVSGELPWRENQNDISCFPPGQYLNLWTYSPHFRRYKYLVNVPGRYGVRIHSANYMGDKSKGYRCQLEGCLALGEKLGVMDGQRALLLSTPAIRRFEELMAGQPFLLEVSNGLA